MISKPSKIIQALKNRDHDLVYLLQGEEIYYIDLIIKTLINHTLSEKEKNFNVTLLEGKNCNLPSICTYARTIPMLGSKQILLINNMQHLADLHQDQAQKVLTQYLLKPVNTTILVFIYKHGKLDGKRAIAKLLMKYATVVESNKLYENQILGWIADYAVSLDFSITEKAQILLHTYIGDNLQILANEIQKITLNLEKNVVIDEEIVQRYVGFSKQYNVFSLQAAFIKKDINQALFILNGLQQTIKTQVLIPTVAFIFTFFSKLLLLYSTKNHSTLHLSKLLKIPSYFLKDYLLAARNYSKEKVIKNLNYIHETDLKIKGIDSAPALPYKLLQELTFKLIYL